MYAMNSEGRESGSAGMHREFELLGGKTSPEARLSSGYGSTWQATSCSG
jgi:hypothetical protein